MRLRRIRPCAALWVAVFLVVSMVACSGPQDSGPAPSSPPPAPALTVAMVTHQPPGDTFWDLVRRGAQAAADKSGLTLEYLHDPDATLQARQVTEVTEVNVAGLAVTLANPPVMADAVRGAVSAGIPVVAVNTGINAWRELGIMAYFGQDDGVAGLEVGDRLTHEAGHNVLCVIQERGHIGLESRCDGVAKTFDGLVQRIYVDGTRPEAVKADLVAKLQQDRSIDRVLTLGAPIAVIALPAVGEANSYAKVVTFDTSAAVIEAVKRGTIGWAVDQQPFLQGYLAIDSLWLYLTNNNVIGGGLPTLTGPSFVDGSNIDEVAKRVEEGTR